MDPISMVDDVTLFRFQPRFGIWKRPVRLHWGECARNLFSRGVISCSCYGMELAQTGEVVIFLGERRALGSHSYMWPIFDKGEVKIASLDKEFRIEEFFREKW